MIRALLTIDDVASRNTPAIVDALAERGIRAIPYAWWRENGLDGDIDTFWTFDFAEYNIRPGSGFTLEDMWRRIDDRSPERGAAILEDGGRHIILLHAHDET